ncbi:hypothetical protein ABT187_48160 [Streptomyces sp. NPDC001817]|uniref:hypothetical protein n=1 Tax=Streptomyces sp. NPDC001817 TaxID=3154398 RepID=UPI0033299ADE
MSSSFFGICPNDLTHFSTAPYVRNATRKGRDVELLVEARQLSAVAPSGMLFTAVNAAVRLGDVAVISGAAGMGPTALLLALSGRFAITDGALHTAGGKRAEAAQLRRRITVAQALPVIQSEPTLRVAEAIAERRIIGGRKNVTAQAVWDALAAMGSEAPPPNALVQEMGPLEQTLFALALARAQNTDGICFDDIDGELAGADRKFVREAVASLASLGPALIVTSRDPGWGTVDIILPAPRGTPAVPAGTDSGALAPQSDTEHGDVESAQNADDEGTRPQDAGGEAP